MNSLADKALTVCLLATGAWVAGGIPGSARAGEKLSLDAFLRQVKQGNTGTQGAAQFSEGARMRAQEGALLLAPTAFSTVQYSRDGKPQIVPLVTYSFQDITNYSLGVSEMTGFGLQAKLSTNLYSIGYENAGSPFLQALLAGQPALASMGISSFGGSVNTTTQLDLTQSIWSNGFGEGTRASQRQLEAQALGQSYGNRYAERTSLVDAEGAYWRLVTTRERVLVTRDNLERARKTYDWNLRRAKLQLADASDALQSQAQLESRRLDYQQALDDEQVASRAFNTARGTASDLVPEALADMNPGSILAMPPPQRGELRDDVRAAGQQSIATEAASSVARERDKPTLDVFTSVGFNGQSPDFGEAFAQSFSLTHPTATVGLRFSAPLSLGAASEARAGYLREEAAADLTYQRKLFEQEQGWKDLSDRLLQARNRLKLAVAVERAQSAKLFHERERYKTGRTTAFQVFTFETDYAQSELARIQSENDVLGILTQMKLYGEEL